ncbi:MAG TPA: PBS lyase, partial [Cyanobacteria bacterium UBA8553]|nr:PBS lyase [Cyanobacteria bacterium UBA8553]
ALENIRQLKLEEVVVVLNYVYEPNQQNFWPSRNTKGFEYWRFLTYFLSGGTDEVKTLLKWVGYSQETPVQLKYEEGKKTLAVFRDAWKACQEQKLQRMQKDLAKQIAVVVSKVSWKPEDITLLQTHYNNLKQGNYNQADTVQSTINKVAVWKWFSSARNTILLHPAFWLALIFAYPK